MSGEVPTQTSEAKVDDTAGLHDLVLCPRCGSERIKRVARVGLFFKYIYPMFGRYPWKCWRCGVTSMMKKRAASKRHRRHSRHSEEKGAKTLPVEPSSPQ